MPFTKKQNQVKGSSLNTILAQVIAVEGEKVWWLFLGDRPLPEDAKIGAEQQNNSNADDDDQLLSGWYLFPEPVIPGTRGSESGDFAFRKGTDKDVVPFYGIIARDIPLVNEASLYEDDDDDDKKKNSSKKSETKPVASHTHRHSWVLRKEDKKFVDVAYRDFLDSERKRLEKIRHEKNLLREQQKKTNKGKVLEKSSTSTKAKLTTATKTSKNDNTTINESSPEYIENMKGWSVLGSKKHQDVNDEPAGTDSCDKPSSYLHAFLWRSNSLNQQNQTSSSILNELVLVQEVKDSDDASSWKRTIFVPMTQAKPDFSFPTTNPVLPQQQSQKVFDENDPVARRQGRHNFLLSGGADKVDFSRNQSLVSNNNGVNNNNTSSFSTAQNRVTEAIQFLTPTNNNTTENEDSALVNFGQTFIAVQTCLCDVPLARYVEENDDKKTTSSPIVKAIADSAVSSSAYTAAIELSEEEVIQLCESGLAALTFLNASLNANKNKKPVAAAAPVKKQSGKRRGRDEESSSSDEEEDEDSDEDSDSDDEEEESSDEDDDDDSDDKPRKRRVAATRKNKSKKPAVASRKRQPVAAKKEKKKPAESAKPPNSAAKKEDVKSRNRKPLSSLLDEVVPAVGSKKNKSNNQQDVAATQDEKEQQQDATDDQQQQTDNNTDTKEEKEKAHFSKLADLLDDVRESCKVAVELNRNGQQQQQQQQQDTSTTTTNNQSTMYPGAGQSVIPSYGEY